MKELMSQKQHNEMNNRSLGFPSNISGHSSHGNFPGNGTSESSVASSSSSSSINASNNRCSSKSRKEKISFEFESRIMETEGRVCKIVSMYANDDAILVSCSSSTQDFFNRIVKSFVVNLVSSTCLFIKTISFLIFQTIV